MGHVGMLVHFAEIFAVLFLMINNTGLSKNSVINHDYIIVHELFHNFVYNFCTTNIFFFFTSLIPCLKNMHHHFPLILNAFHHYSYNFHRKNTLISTFPYFHHFIHPHLFFLIFTFTVAPWACDNCLSRCRMM